MSPTEFEALLVDALPGLARSRKSDKRRPWLLPLGTDEHAEVQIAIDADWASLRTTAEWVPPRLGLDVLRAQSAWPGTVKCVELQPLSILRADVPLLSNTAAGRVWIVRQLRPIPAGLLAAASGAEQPALSLQQEAGSAQDPELLALACTAAGWSTAVKPDGTVRIDLQVRGAPRSILLQADSTGVRASVALATDTCSRASPVCIEAAATLLIRASAALRWARAFARQENGQLAGIGFECFIAAPHDDQALLLAIDSLIAACELFGREAEVLLEHPEIASLYLRFVPGSDHAAEVDVPINGRPARRVTRLSHAAHAALA